MILSSQAECKAGAGSLYAPVSDRATLSFDSAALAESVQILVTETGIPVLGGAFRAFDGWRSERDK